MENETPSMRRGIRAAEVGPKVGSTMAYRDPYAWKVK